MAGFELFGFEIKSKDKKKRKTFVTPENLDGATQVVEGGGVYGHYLDTGVDAKDENVLIQKYREMSMSQEVDLAISDVVNEAVVHEDGKTTISLSLDNVEQSDGIKTKISNEFKSILKLLDFNKTGSDLFKKWYVDGKLYHHIIIDKNKVKDGIKELVPIDALNIQKIDEVKKEKDPVTNVEMVVDTQEYFVYTPSQSNQSFINTAGSELVRVSPDSISYVHSGMVDNQKQIIIGYLYKSIKPYNQLRMIEDSLVIYRLARAPERRIFYIDVGNLPKLKAEQYLRSVMDKYKQKVIYNASTGEVEDQKKQMSMLEDFWLPRRDGGRGTEISTLPSGQNLGEIEDIEYFRKKLYQSLSVPISRIEGTEQTAFNLGRASEINRDEIKFAKFIAKLRHRFSHLFTDLLRIQLILKGIINEEDWFEIKDDIDYIWTIDSHFSELKNNEIIRERFEILQTMEEYIGKFISKEWVQKNILKQTDEDIKEMQKQIDKEKEEEVPDEDDVDVDAEDF
ncbi:MAG: portal protein [Candidatus Pacebacteria bacterium]|nr:portal protein [Candidatus Paceibacterota bacterium]